MANQVTFQIKIETVGGDSVKNVTMDAEELGRVVREVSEEQEKLNTKLLDINQAQQAIQNVTSGISQIATEISKYTAAYTTQETAEKKVAQVMRNTMNATEAEVESIKKLCSAQQELGVIGDEVQLSGAQELATYLEKKSSLEKLIPVMNDMLAQQYGLEASQESAAQIATMLGKVMDGQVNALSRYGYSFDEAQEKILKFGTEEERAATLAEVVSQSVGGMNQALAQMDSGKAKQVANTIGDIKEMIGSCMITIEPFVSSLAEVGMAAQGIMSVYQGVRGLTIGISSLTIVQRGYNMVSVTTTAIIRTLTAALQGGAVGATTLRVAIRGLLVSTGVGIAIVALTAAINKLMDVSEDTADATEKLSAAEATEASQLQQNRAALEVNIARLKDFHGTKEQEKKIVDELNDTYGQTMGYFSSVSQWYDALVKNSETYCRQMEIEARTRLLANQIAEKEQENRRLLKDESGQARQFSKQRLSIGGTEVEGSSEWEVATRTYKQNIDLIKTLRQELRGAAREAAEVQLPVVGSPVRQAGSSPANTPRTGRSGGNGGQVAMNTGKIGGLNLGGFSAAIDLTPRIDEEQALKDLNNLGWEVEVKLDAQGLRKIEQEADKARKKFDFATESVESLGSSLAGLGGAVGVPELNVIGIMAQSIATMVQGYATASAQASVMGPWAWLAFGALGLAQLTAMVNGVKNISKFADGGVAYGPTLGLFGEYANAATNPEVVAPLDKLQGLIGTDGGGVVQVKLKVRGRDLVGVSDGRRKLVRRT